MEVSGQLYASTILSPTKIFRCPLSWRLFSRSAKLDALGKGKLAFFFRESTYGFLVSRLQPIRYLDNVLPVPVM
jgi:hypothetical protein